MQKGIKRVTRRRCTKASSSGTQIEAQALAKAAHEIPDFLPRSANSLTKKLLLPPYELPFFSLLFFLVLCEK